MGWTHGFVGYIHDDGSRIFRVWEGGQDGRWVYVLKGNVINAPDLGTFPTPAQAMTEHGRRCAEARAKGKEQPA